VSGACKLRPPTQAASRLKLNDDTHIFILMPVTLKARRKMQPRPHTASALLLQWTYTHANWFISCNSLLADFHSLVLGADLLVYGCVRGLLQHFSARRVHCPRSDFNESVIYPPALQSVLSICFSSLRSADADPALCNNPLSEKFNRTHDYCKSDEMKIVHARILLYNEHANWLCT
jgi:hypothetical protein